MESPVRNRREGSFLFLGFSSHAKLVACQKIIMMPLKKQSYQETFLILALLVFRAGGSAVDIEGPSVYQGQQI